MRSRRVRPKTSAQAPPTHPRRPEALPLVQHAAIGMDEFTGLGGIRAQITDQRIITPGGQTNILAIGLFRHCQAKPRGGGAYRGMSPRGKRAIASGARVVAARKQIWSRSGFTARCNSAPLVHLPKAESPADNRQSSRAEFFFPGLPTSRFASWRDAIYDRPLN